MKMLVFSAALAAAAALAAPAFAQTPGGLYGGLGYTHYDLDEAEVGGVTGRVGYRFHPNFAVEGEGTIGTSDDDNADLDAAYGVYGVGVLPVTSNFDVLGRVGYQAVDINGSGPVADVDEDGLGYGVGANYRLTQNFGVRADYTRLEGDEDTDAISLGGTVNF